MCHDLQEMDTGNIGKPLYTPMPQTNTGTVLKYETIANLFSAEFFSLLYLILGYSLYLGL